MREKKNGKNSYKSALLSHHWISFRQSFILCNYCVGVMSKFLWLHMHDPLCGSWMCYHRVHSCHCTISWKENDKHAFLHWVDVVVSNTSFASDIMQVQYHQSWCLPTLVIERFFRCPRNCTCSVRRWNLIFSTVTMAHLSGWALHMVLNLHILH